jgi:pimeloyl-ACP methyl ester carboxylesterase
MSELDVPGARLYYAVEGAGPPLLMLTGGAADADDFDLIAPILAERYTVIRCDQRGISRSSLTEPPSGDLLQCQADDSHRLLRALGAEPAYVLGSSGGAQAGLALAAAHPGQIRMLIAHEPPAATLLPPDDPRHTLGPDVRDTYRRDGVIPALHRFIVGTGLDSEPAPPGVVDHEERRRRRQRNVGFFFENLIAPVTGYAPDAAALGDALSRVVIAVGEESAGQFAHECGLAMARRLGMPPIVFPGGHYGYLARPDAFALRVRDVLESPH